MSNDSVGYSVTVQSDIRTGVDRAKLERLAGKTMRAERVVRRSELSVLLTDDRTIRRLNRRYRSTNSATDVLSFAQEDGLPMRRVGAPHLGDVVISIETARVQAAQHRIALNDEVAHLLVHGILHLLGYDHERSADAKIMREREDAILGSAHHGDT